MVMCKVALLFLFRFLELQVLSLVSVPARLAVAASRVGKGSMSRQNLDSTRWAGRPRTEHTKTSSGRLWCRAEEPLPLREKQSGIAQEAPIPVKDEPYLPLLRALIQKLRPICLWVCTALIDGLGHLLALSKGIVVNCCPFCHQAGNVRSGKFLESSIFQRCL
eukprot:1136267-Pelagomonas_calceolata.AAC.2